MYLEPIFSTPIWSEKLNLNTSSIESYSYDLRKKDSGRIISNHGGWQSSDLYNLDNTPLQNLINDTKKLLKICFETLQVSKEPIIDNTWININPPGSFNKSHIHGNNSFLSAVYYVKAEKNCGNIYFDRGSKEEYILSNFIPEGMNVFNSSRWQYKAEENKLIIFPSWLSHSVGINNSNSDRISIALNIRL